MNGHNTNVNPSLHLSDLHREHSNTISSYHADSEIYPIDDDEPMTPSTTRRVHHGQLSPTSPKSVKFDIDPEIEERAAAAARIANGHNGSISSHGRASSQKQKQLMKKKKKILNKPKRRKRHIQSQKYRQSKTPKAAQMSRSKLHRTTPQSPNQMLPPPVLSKSRSHPTLITATQNQNTSSYIANIHNRYQATHIHVTQSPQISSIRTPSSMTPTAVVMTPTSPLQKGITTQHSPNQTAITINHSAMKPYSKIIVFKTKKATPIIAPQIAQSSNDIDEEEYDGLSTPTLSDNGVSDHEDDVINSKMNNNKARCSDDDEQNTSKMVDTPVPVPLHQKKKGNKIVHIKSQESANMEFAANRCETADQILNETHFYAESGDEHEHETDPLD